MPVSNPATLRSVRTILQGGDSFRNYLRSTNVVSVLQNSYGYGQTFPALGGSNYVQSPSAGIFLATASYWGQELDSKGGVLWEGMVNGNAVLALPLTPDSSVYQFDFSGSGSGWGVIQIYNYNQTATYCDSYVCTNTQSGSFGTGVVPPPIAQTSTWWHRLVVTSVPNGNAGYWFNLSAVRRYKSVAGTEQGKMTPSNPENMGIATAFPLSLRSFAGATPAAQIPLSASLSGTTAMNPTPAYGAAATLNSSTVLTVVPAGGSGTRSYAWSKVSGSAEITISGGTTGTTCTFAVSSYASTAQTKNFSASVKCRVTDSTGYYDAVVTITSTMQWIAQAAIAVSNSYPGNQTTSRTSGSSSLLNWGAVTVGATGGTGGYTYSWNRVGGGSAYFGVSGSGASVYLQCTESYGNGTYIVDDYYQCVVYDSFGNYGYSVTFHPYFTHTVNVAALPNNASLSFGAQVGGTGSTSPQTATRTATISNAPAGSSFSWSVTAGYGTTIISGQGTSSITLSCTNTATAGGMAWAPTVTCVVTAPGYQTASPSASCQFNLYLTASQMTASISPSTVSGSCISTTTCTARSTAATVTVNGGSPPAGTTYNWVVTSGAGVTINSGQGTASCSFKATGSTPDGVSGTARCDVAAPGWTSPTSPTVNISLSFEYADPSCPAPWVPLLMADKTWRKAGDIQVGDLVWAYSEESGEYGAYPVIDAHFSTNDHWHVIMRDGRAITCAPNHRFFVNGAWKEVQNMRPGDIIEGTQPGEVVEIGFELTDQPVVKITVENAHTYVLSGLLSHNAKMDP